MERLKRIQSFVKEHKKEVIGAGIGLAGGALLNYLAINNSDIALDMLRVGQMAYIEAASGLIGTSVGSLLAKKQNKQIEKENSVNIQS